MVGPAGFLAQARGQVFSCFLSSSDGDVCNSEGRGVKVVSICYQLLVNSQPPVLITWVLAISRPRPSPRAALRGPLADLQNEGGGLRAPAHGPGGGKSPPSEGRQTGQIQESHWLHKICKSGL
jgi:hypothetical protein